MEKKENLIEIKHENDDSKGQFIVFVDGNEAGNLTYTNAGDGNNN